MSPFFLLFVENFLIGCAIGSTALLPPYLVSLGANQTLVGVFNVIPTLAIIVVVVLFGTKLVRLPRVRTLRIGFAVLVAASALSWVFSGSLALLIVFRVLGSAAQVFGWTLMLSLLFDQTPSNKRASSLALFGVAGIITNPLSALAGEAVVRTWGGPGLFLLTGAFALAAWLWSLLLREPRTVPSDEVPHSFLEVVARPDMRTLVALAFAFGIYFSVLVSFLPGHTQKALGEANLSAFLIPFSIVSVALRLVLGGQLDKRPPRRFLYFSFGAVAVAQGLLLLPASWIWLVASGFFYGIGHSILFPLLNSLFVHKGGEDQKAVYSNAFTVSNLAGAVVMTPVLGALGDLFGFVAVPLVLGATALAAVVLVRAQFARGPVRRPEAGLPSDRSS